LAGVNCSMGPARVLDFVTEMHRAEPSLRLSAMPNAGLPYRAGDRMVYPSAPHYFARHIAPMIDAGVAVVGGCCGTTPAHTRAMRSALDELLQRTHAAPEIGREELAALPWSACRRWGCRRRRRMPRSRPGCCGSSTPASSSSASRWIPARVQRGEDAGRGARGAGAGADAVNVADSPMARVRMGALALCLLIQQQVGIETILHFTTRDRSLMGIQADLIGAHALGVRNIIALTGDPPSLGDQPESTAVYDVDSIGLVKLISQFNEGLDARASRSAAGRRSPSSSHPIRRATTWRARWIASIVR